MIVFGLFLSYGGDKYVRLLFVFICINRLKTFHDFLTLFITLFLDNIHAMVAKRCGSGIDRWKALSVGKFSRSTGLSREIWSLQERSPWLFLDTVGSVQELHQGVSTETRAGEIKGTLTLNSFFPYLSLSLVCFCLARRKQEGIGEHRKSTNWTNLKS